MKLSRTPSPFAAVINAHAEDKVRYVFTGGMWGRLFRVTYQRSFDWIGVSC
jgi:hypothetical protein